MNEQRNQSAGKESIFRQPEMIVAMAAIVLSICGLFIALYEASIARRAERASVWPHVEVSTSVQGTNVEIFVRNTGVGPARIRAANVSHLGDIVTGWSALLKRLDIDVGTIRRSYSLIGGRVLGVDSEAETIFAVDVRPESPGSDATLRLAAAIFESRVDVTLCYCSVYDECWIASMQDILDRGRVSERVDTDKEHADCDSVPQSAI